MRELYFLAVGKLQGGAPPDSVMVSTNADRGIRQPRLRLQHTHAGRGTHRSDQRNRGGWPAPRKNYPLVLFKFFVHGAKHERPRLLSSTVEGHG
jgi:hypothetical protein